MPGNGLGLRRLLLELDDLLPVVDTHHAEFAGLLDRDVHAGDGDFGPGFDVVFDHRRIVHAVNVVAGEDQNVLGAAPFEQVQVLIDGVRRADIPRIAGPHLGRDDGDVLLNLRVEDRPAVPQMFLQRMGLVLGEHQHPANARMQAVAQGEVDDAVFPGKRDRGLGPIDGERVQPGADAPGENDRECLVEHRVVSAERATGRDNQADHPSCGG
jgi:hypothetical protein